jgi:hypothetical protein
MPSRKKLQGQVRVRKAKKGRQAHEHARKHAEDAKKRMRHALCFVQSL